MLGGSQDPSPPYIFDNQKLACRMKALAWNPNHEGLLAVGGGFGE
jgi:hypothetical protein